MANSVFIVRNISTADVELKDFGLILSPSINIDLENYDLASLSVELDNYLLSKTLVRVINGVDVSYNQAYASSAPIYNLDASLSIYATNSSVNLALGSYVTNVSVNLYAAKNDASIIALQNADKTFATNASVGLAIAPFATNASVGLALNPFATNASVGLALGAYATNSSVNSALFTINASFAAYATNASVNLALGAYATNSSVNLYVVKNDASIIALQNADKTFATNASVGLAIAPFATNASIGLAGFLKSVDISSFATNASVGLALGPYATNASVGLAIAPFATNASSNLAFANRDASLIALRNADLTFATNASIGLAGFLKNVDISPFATNASVGLAIAPFATNASVGLAIQNFATNASVNTALLKYIPNASLGADFYWQAGLLEVSIGSILSLGKNLTLDASGNIAVVNSPNFSGDVSVQGNIFANQKIQLKSFSLSNSSTGDLWWQSPRLFFNDGSTNRDLLQGALKGTVYPASPSEGDIYYRTDQGLQYIYDSSRGKYLATNRNTLNCGRTSAVAGTTTYMRVGDGTQSTTAGFKMFRNGTILGFSVDQNNTLTAPRDMQIRVNDVSALTKPIPIGGKSVYFTQGNVDFAEGDLLQVVAVAGGVGSSLNNIIVIVEIAWRA